MKALIWAGVQLIGTLTIWGVMLGTELIIETGRHLPAGVSISTVHGNKNFSGVVIAILATVAFAFANAFIVSETFDVKVTAK